MAEAIPSLGFDEKSNLWLRPFSVIINCMFPVEYVYGEWFWWQGVTKASHADPESLGSRPSTDEEAGSRVEGFCIPQGLFAKSDVDPLMEPLELKEHWQPDLDVMSVKEPFVENESKETIPIFSVEHCSDDPRYAKLRLSEEWKEDRPRYKTTSFLHHTFLLPSGDHPLPKMETEKGRKWVYELHGPVRKLQSDAFPSYEEDQAYVFRYPTAWPEPAMEWLVRPRPSGWPSAELVQEIFESGCHLAAVGRGRRYDEPIELLEYVKNPELAADAMVPPDEREHRDKTSAMDQAEWRVSFSLAENKLGESVSPLQRHVVVLLKMMKKVYFPEVICSYHLKNLLFWECENQDESFWREENSGRCLLTMLDRLQDCLEERCLPHYIMPQSNLLRYEDPVKLAEAAAIVADARRHVLPKTVSLLKRLQSLTYQSNIYLKNLEVEPHFAEIQHSSLLEDQVTELLCALQEVFVGKCKDVITSLHRNQKAPEAANIQDLLLIPMYAYQSLLARILCNLWFAKSDSNSHENASDAEFSLFVEEEVKGHSLGEEFIALTLVFFGEMKKGRDPSALLPGTVVMGHLKQIQEKLARKSVEDARAPMKDQFGWLQTSDFKNIETKLTDILKGRVDGITMDDITKLVNSELAALFEERQVLTPQETSDSGAGPSSAAEQEQ